MNVKRIAMMCSVVTLAAWVSATAAAHDKECRSAPRIVGLWNMHVTPLPNPEVAEVPAPFTALFEFETGGTFNETDTGFHPNAAIELFPNLGPLSGSDGLGAWEAESGSRYHGRFIKNLFDASGQHVGYVITRISIELLGADRLEAEATSDFVLGDDIDAPPFFSGGITQATGSRVRAR